MLIGKVIATPRICAAISLLVFLFAHKTIASDNLRTVALENEAVSGAGNGIYFQSFGKPALNRHGETAFGVQFTGPGVDISNPFFSNIFGIVSEGEGNGLELVAQSKNPAPQLGSNVYFMALEDEVVLNDNGVIAFKAFLTGPGVDTSSNTSNDDAIYKTGPSGLSLVSRSGSLAPGATPSTDYWFYGSISLNNSNQVAFDAALRESGHRNSKNHGFFRENLSGSIELVARNGNAAPGTSPPVSFDVMGSYALNDLGGVAFQAVLGQSGADTGYFRDNGGGVMNLVTRIGDQAIPASPDIVFDSFNGLAFNNLGTIAYRAFFADASDTQIGSGIFRQRNRGNPELVAKSGEQVPGLTSGANFNGFYYKISLNDRNQTAFIGAYSGVFSGNAIFSDGQGNGLEIVARQGEPAPGLGPGVVFDSFLGPAIGSEIVPVLNRRGQTAFLGLTGTGVGNSNRYALYAEDIHGNLQLIACTGGLLDVSDDPSSSEFRTILNLWFDPESGFNDRGQLAFKADFTDGTSGVFVSDLVSVPEPTAFTLFLFAGASQFLVARYSRRY